MNALLSFIVFLFLFVVGFAALALAILLTLIIGIYSYKAIRLLNALANAAIKEPEEKIVKKVRRLSKTAKRLKG